jgi:hypothetical protein
VANGTVGNPLLEGIDYLSLMGNEPSAIEQAFAIFANVIEIGRRRNRPERSSRSTASRTVSEELLRSRLFV